MSDWTATTTAVEEAFTAKAKVNYKGMNSATVVLRVPWADRYTCAADILNNNRLWPEYSIGAIAAEIEISPAPNSAAVSVTNGVIAYAEALLTISYNVAEIASLEKVASGPNAGILYNESLEPNIEYIKLPHINFNWGTSAGNDRVKEQEAPSRPSRSFNLVRTYYNLPSIDSSYLDLGDTSNNASYTSVPLGLTFAAGTLRFIPAPITRTILTSGSKGWNLTLKWAYRKDTWNKFYHITKSGGAGYESMYDNVNGAVYEPCPQADHTPWLFG